MYFSKGVLRTNFATLDLCSHTLWTCGPAGSFPFTVVLSYKGKPALKLGREISLTSLEQYDANEPYFCLSK